ncbi:FAD-dependent monooxygenase [Streptosporangium roseum]|uniref:FAD-dependent monooxygenase n=1 Tax=Streptosporangium roseum TaxID=2001 RepID=UPI002F35D5AD
MREVVWGSRFRVHRRVADASRTGRVVPAGDVAHVHSPAGGQGTNTGIPRRHRPRRGPPRRSEGRSGRSGRLRGGPSPRGGAGRRLRRAAHPAGHRGQASAPGPEPGAADPAGVPAFRRGLAWRLSDLVYR